MIGAEAGGAAAVLLALTAALVAFLVWALNRIAPRLGWWLLAILALAAAAHPLLL